MRKGTPLGGKGETRRREERKRMRGIEGGKRKGRELEEDGRKGKEGAAKKWGRSGEKGKG